jgi:hypothetical protein
VIDAREAAELETQALPVKALVFAVLARLDNLPRDADDWSTIARQLEAAARRARRQLTNALERGR